MAKNFPQQLRDLALSYPGAIEATSCNKAAFKTGKRAFLYVGEKEDSWNMMFKLDESLGELQLLAERKPENYSVGMKGWITLRFPTGKGPTKKQIERWVDESFRLFATKTILSELDG